MHKKTEVFKANLPDLAIIPCALCGSDTYHKIVSSYEIETIYTEDQHLTDDLFCAMQIVRCEQCEDVTFRELFAAAGCEVQNSQGDWVNPVTEFFYPRQVDAPQRQFDADESTYVFRAGTETLV